MFPELESIAFEALPFEHFVGRWEPSADGAEWIDWLEREAPWEPTKAEFYEQYEFSLLHAPLPDRVGNLVRPKTLAALRHRMSEHFRHPLDEHVEVTAHKLVAGQTIRIHNDYIPGGESHRLLLQLNRSWDPSYGGYLMFFSGPEPETVGKVLEPRHGTVQAFAISPRSHHAVSTVYAGERFTLVYSFFSASR